MLEKMEECADCGDSKNWSYDGQVCRSCEAKSDDLTHAQYCRLSRIFNLTANLNINSPDYAINEWLKARIAAKAGDRP